MLYSPKPANLLLGFLCQGRQKAFILLLFLQLEEARDALELGPWIQRSVSNQLNWDQDADCVLESEHKWIWFGLNSDPVWQEKKKSQLFGGLCLCPLSAQEALFSAKETRGLSVYRCSFLHMGDRPGSISEGNRLVSVKAQRQRCLWPPSRAPLQLLCHAEVFFSFSAWELRLFSDFWVNNVNIY